ncbi:hypothetical protein NJL88_41590, partial [Streptomyces sp. DK15]|uniref:hypothetical protein n=1 Tax=Streptomyces sp. DK15 TaxID=2957499 RepID=UPI0029AB3B47
AGSQALRAWEVKAVSLRSTGLGFAEPGPALRAGVLRFASDWFGASLRSVPNGPLRGSPRRCASGASAEPRQSPLFERDLQRAALE